jgi:DNA-binding XRE family transcriptional regulator
VVGKLLKEIGLFLYLQRRIVYIMPHDESVCQVFFLTFFMFFDKITLIMPQKPKENFIPLNLCDETLGQRIARIRKKRKLTQKELADKIGITRSRLSNYEIDRNRLYDELLIRFAIALDVSLDYLVGLKDKPEPLPKK